MSAASLRRVVTEIVWPRRWMLLLGLGLIAVNRLTGLVLPGGVEVPDRRRDRRPRHRPARRAAARRVRRGADAGGQLVPAHPAAERAGATPDLGAARPRAAPPAAPAGGVLRQQPDRRPGVARDDRRRGGAQPGRHRAGAPGGRRPDHGGGADPAAAHQRADDPLHLPAAGRVRRRLGARVRHDPADLPAARRHHRGGDRAPDRGDGRHPGDQGIPRRAARGARVRPPAWSASSPTCAAPSPPPAW